MYTEEHSCVVVYMCGNVFKREKCDLYVLKRSQYSFFLNINCVGLAQVTHDVRPDVKNVCKCNDD